MKATNSPRDLFFDQMRALHSMESQMAASLFAMEPYPAITAGLKH
ncbi:MAG: hypothetical protein ABIT37_15745 [Luteolibacter sp.]